MLENMAPLRARPPAHWLTGLRALVRKGGVEPKREATWAPDLTESAQIEKSEGVVKDGKRMNWELG